MLFACLARAVPAVLLVVQGGPGTLTTVVLAVEKGVPVLVIADSLGAASAIRDFITRTKDEEKAITDAQSEKEKCKAAHAEALVKQGVAMDACKETETEATKKAWSTARASTRKARKDLDRAESSLLAHERKLFKDPKVATDFKDPKSIYKLRAIYEKKALVKLYELAENEGADISQVTVARTRRAAGGLARAGTRTPRAPSRSVHLPFDPPPRSRLLAHAHTHARTCTRSRSSPRSRSTKSCKSTAFSSSPSNGTTYQ
jgi:hypothetical protein